MLYNAHTWSHRQSCCTPGPVSIGMGDHIRVQLRLRVNLSRYVTSDPGQLSLAIHPWVGDSHALRLGVKAGIARVWWQLKLCDLL